MKILVSNITKHAKVVCANFVCGGVSEKLYKLGLKPADFTHKFAGLK